MSTDVKLFLEVFLATWNEFYAWERQDSAIILERLGQQSHTQRLMPRWMKPAAQKDRESVTNLLDDFESNSVNNDDEVEVIEYLTIPAGSISKKVEKHISVTLKALQDVKPYPLYETCVPLQRNTAPTDDSPTLSFVPFADDAEFDFVNYCDEHKHFHWQGSTKDPNLEHIVIETTRKLHDIHSQSMEQIEEVLPPNLSTTLHMYQRRDFLPWPPGLCQSSSLHKRANFTPERVATAMMQLFCSSCGTGYCFNHVKSRLPCAVQAFVTDRVLKRETETLCGQSCFLADTEEPLTTWTDVDEEQIKICADYIPDMTPCGMARICGKPCNEVFMYRKRLVLLATKKRTRRQIQMNGFLDHCGSNEFAYHEDSPCAHSGPCTDGCPCVKSMAHCVSRCLCDQSCSRRWQGCKCAKSKSRSTCMDRRCPCFRASRECDPDICANCNARWATARIKMGVAMCKYNVVKPRTSVRQTAFGFGLFIEDVAKKNELIDEYVGELIYEASALSRSYIERHRRRNYLFCLNSALSVDSSFAGNSTRYINHSADESNCSAKVWLINGEQRIGIMASRDLEAGEELLMDYGDVFFINEQVLPGGAEESPCGRDTPQGPMKGAISSLVEDTAPWPPMEDSSDETYQDADGSDSS